MVRAMEIWRQTMRHRAVTIFIWEAGSQMSVRNGLPLRLAAEWQTRSAAYTVSKNVWRRVRFLRTAYAGSQLIRAAMMTPRRCSLSQSSDLAKAVRRPVVMMLRFASRHRIERKQAASKRYGMTYCAIATVFRWAADRQISAVFRADA
jgi:hypothetical protein